MKKVKLLFKLLLSLLAAYIVYIRFDSNYINYDKYEVNSTVVDNILSQIITPEMDTYNKVKYIHDYIVSTTEYDHINLENNTIPDIDYTAKGVLENHIGVCRGYAEAFKLLMDNLNIECEIETGYADGISHAWNVVKIDNEWYQIDCTYDDPVDVSGDNTQNNYLRYDYFLITSAQMYIDHQSDKQKHLCSSEKYMYQEKQKDIPYYILDSVQQLPTNITYLYGQGYHKVTFYFPDYTDLSDGTLLNDISKMLGYSGNASQFSYTPVMKCGKYYYTTLTVS